ncbi:hypothetical protein P3X46_029823 [Hevea brasiliensis]|uniref:Uncharacterized protein n=1 Tax=Hevea brasiliensis TaxID=3981 RepID=A0ABQ9KVI3_HEVBR|nr:hypothetical protein P3X46_029823 [Hevea brasiliensis]
MLHIMLSGMTQGSTGSAILFTSTGSSGASLLPGRNTGVYEERDICTTRIALLAGQPGRETTLSPFVATVEFIDVLEIVSSWILSRGQSSYHFELEIMDVEMLGLHCFGNLTV